MALIDVGDITIYHEVHGDGPPVLNITGTGNDLRRTRPDVSPLNDRFSVLSFDQRGLGRTTRPDTPSTMADYADDAAGLVASIGWDRCHVIGTSFGGMVALELAIRHPGLIDRLVLCCTSPGGSFASAPLHEIMDQDPAVAADEQIRLMDDRADPSADEPIPGLGAIGTMIADQLRRARPTDVEPGLRGQLVARAGHDVVDRLGEIGQPTLVCAGRHDRLAPLANSEVLVERIPDATLRVFDGGHLFLLQDATAMPAIMEFLG